VNQGGAGPANPFNGYSRIAADSSANNEGLNSSNSLLGITGGSNLRSSLYIEDMHYHQHFKAGIPLLTDWTFGANTDKSWQASGDLYVGSMPWRYLYDKSPYRGNEQTQFQNTAFVNTPGVAVNQNAPMIAYQWHQQLGSDNLSADLTTGLGSINVGDVMDGLNLTYEGRLNYKVLDMPGNLYAGGYNIWGMGNTTNPAALLTGNVNRSGGTSRVAAGRQSTNAVYAGWNQEWYKGIGTTINYMYTSNGGWNYAYLTNNQTLGANTAAVRTAVGTTTPVTVGARQSVTGVLSIPMSVFGVRENDVFGVGYSAISLQKDGLTNNFPSRTRFRNTWEQTVEAYYKYAVNDAFAIIPSVQIISNSLGIAQNGINTVIGLRTSYAF
jgi:hypothetical protein